MGMAPYEERAQEYGFADKQAVREALAHPETVVLDVRTQEEIAAGGTHNNKVHPATKANWVQTDCTADDCPHLRESPAKFVSDNKNATIVIYCRSGRRAAAAKNVLLGQGYSGTILNAGGFDDIIGLASSSS